MKRLPLWLTLIAQSQILVYLALLGLRAESRFALSDDTSLTIYETGIVLLFAGGGLQCLLLPWLWWWRTRMGLGMAAAVILSVIGAVYAFAITVLVLTALALAGS